MGCTACGTQIPEGAPRCPACGAVSGEDNRCPSCHAVASVRRSGEGYVCMACGKPRQKLPGTVINDAGGPLGGGATARIGPGKASRVAGKGASIGLRTFGILSIGAGLLASVAAGAVLSSFIIPVGLAVTGIAVGAGAIIAGGRASVAAEGFARRELEQQILTLAEREGGILTVTQIVQKLGVSAEHAEEALDAMTDGTRIQAEVHPEGYLYYEFRELRGAKKAEAASAPADAPKVRVAIDEPRTFEERMEALERAEREREA